MNEPLPVAAIHVYRAQLVHFPKSTDNPSVDFMFERDGALVVQGAKILDIGNYASLKKHYPGAILHDYSDKLIIPGLIDSHVHFVQTEMIASYGEQLLAWLQNYTFPTEQKFSDPEYCQAMAEVFIRQLLKNGTTTALAYSSVHAQSVDALFAAAEKRNMCMITGKTCMDSPQQTPVNLRDSASLALEESTLLIDKWHKKARNYYAITPRFVPTSTDEQLTALGNLAAAYPDTFIQTHLSENQIEIAMVAERFPQHASYLDVYDHFGLVRERAVFGHCVHLPQASWRKLHDKKATIAFCPSSNLFLGSGLFDFKTALEHSVKTTLASDVGAGTSFNMLRTYGEAYKVCQLQQQSLAPLYGLYMMTQGAASAHNLDSEIGNLNPGSFADFVVLDPEFDELASVRNQVSEQVSDTLFALSVLADDRAIQQTFVAGKPMLNTSFREETYAVA